MVVYVTAEYDCIEGNKFFKSITWYDGRVLPVDHFLESGPYVFAGQNVHRYSLVIGGKRRFLYEDSDGRFFVIVKD